MNDNETDLQTLKDKVHAFAVERDWLPFHTLKNLSMSISIEAAELMEHFQWTTPEESDRKAFDPEQQTQIADELADVIIYSLQFANIAKINLAAAIDRKMAINAKKYPAQ